MLDVLEGKSGIVVQLLGVSGPLSKKFGLEIFMGERRTTVKFSPVLQLFMPNLLKFWQSIESTNMSTGSDPVQGACAHTSCNYVENLKVSVLQLPSVLRLEDATELQFPCTSRHDCVKIFETCAKKSECAKNGMVAGRFSFGIVIFLNFMADARSFLARPRAGCSK